ncbi:MAG: hypothetical protein ABH857_01720 [Elusimicrobiota bacterium]
MLRKKSKRNELYKYLVLHWHFLAGQDEETLNEILLKFNSKDVNGNMQIFKYTVIMLHILEEMGKRLNLSQEGIQQAYNDLNSVFTSGLLPALKGHGIKYNFPNGPDNFDLMYLYYPYIYADITNSGGESFFIGGINALTKDDLLTPMQKYREEYKKEHGHDIADIETGIGHSDAGKTQISLFGKAVDAIDSMYQIVTLKSVAEGFDNPLKDLQKKSEGNIEPAWDVEYIELKDKLTGLKQELPYLAVVKAVTGNVHTMRISERFGNILEIMRGILAKEDYEKLITEIKEHEKMEINEGAVKHDEILMRDNQKYAKKFQEEIIDVCDTLLNIKEIGDREMRKQMWDNIDKVKRAIYEMTGKSIDYDKILNAFFNLKKLYLLDKARGEIKLEDGNYLTYDGIVYTQERNLAAPPVVENVTFGMWAELFGKLSEGLGTILNGENTGVKEAFNTANMLVTHFDRNGRNYDQNMMLFDKLDRAV